MTTEPDCYSYILQTLVAIGTIAVAVLAIWGEWFRSKFASPKLKIEIHNIRGTVTKFTSGSRVIYYHLRVINSRHWVTAHNCRVILRGLYRRMPDQNFSAVPLSVPFQFVWAPLELTPPVIELSTQQVLDFGRVAEGSDHFEPILYSYPSDFQGFVKANQAVRYALEIRADGFSAKHLQVFEVAWDGRWSDNLETMSQSLVIREIENAKI